MKSSIKIFFTSLFTFFIFSPKSIFAQTKDWATQNSKCVSNGVATIQGIECLFYNIIQVAVSLIGLAFFVMLIYGGFNYLYSQGNDKKIAGAQAALSHAVIGLVGTIASWLILSLIKQFTGIDVLNFAIPSL
jgi:hypothetical protein